MSAVVLQGLLDYLKSTLTMDNRQWLAEHLIEPSADVRPYTKEELVTRVEEAEEDIAAGRFHTEEEMEAFMDDALLKLKERKAA
jgi:predicted transcriptional regulator